ncbi:NUDIX domain-containing protein [Caulobacter sp. 17J80-11]|uniref:NUDIX domain-containing protein n=1 Tax=Caulobacter sp. 17J80-11 TaxID=2763502 RepID=UPI0016539669|nr:NUDIX domain-containing protein [Caulobacter sp. 17J80-11]MBC6981103.1 NUDIX domain-containing protein [Caulobacter sp. 17J80-11]
MSDPRALQFGEQKPGLDYQDRPCAFGVLPRDGKIACVQVDRGEGSYFDLPGGAIDGGETEAEALVREFAEETGLTVRAGETFAWAGQYFQKSDGQPVNNLAAFVTADAVGEDPSAKVEEDHELVWLDPHDALAKLRHDAHAWAVAAWLRRGKRG